MTFTHQSRNMRMKKYAGAVCGSWMQLLDLSSTFIPSLT